MPGKMLSPQEKKKQAKEAEEKKKADAAKKTDTKAKWTLDSKKVSSPNLDAASKKSLDHFMAGVKAGKHPKEAATGSDYNYKLLKGTKNQYEIRLNGADRATFLVDDDAHLVTMLQAGGHT